ncbi:MAG: hypothetical protein FWE74_06820 [Oscillospiraceae bacterium]|nr:hypothetical protein [Oscillospiraceae bacterium]
MELPRCLAATVVIFTVQELAFAAQELAVFAAQATLQAAAETAAAKAASVAVIEIAADSEQVAEIASSKHDVSPFFNNFLFFDILLHYMPKFARCEKKKIPPEFEVQAG